MRMEFRTVTHRWLSLILVLISLRAQLRAESWTNQAGVAINAEATALERGIVTLKKPLLPDYVRRAHRDAMALIERYDRMPESRRTEGGRDAVVRASLALFDHRIAAGSGKEMAERFRGEVAQLRLTIR